MVHATREREIDETAGPSRATIRNVRAHPAGDVDYERRGTGYASVRKADPRIAAVVHAALGNARTVINVGAGAGSYEPTDREVAAIEPSATMRAQRPPTLPPAIDGIAEALPFADATFDAALASVTVHQWTDLERGVAELRRVTRGPIVVVTFDPEAIDAFWLREYAPELLDAERARYPTMQRLRDLLGGDVTVSAVPIPLDCTDGFTEAFYGRPGAFLDPSVRQAQSAWAFVGAAAEERAVTELADDLASGAWDERHGHLRSQPTYDGSLRLVVSTGR